MNGRELRSLLSTLTEDELELQVVTDEEGRQIDFNSVYLATAEPGMRGEFVINLGPSMSNREVRALVLPASNEFNFNDCEPVGCSPWSIVNKMVFDCAWDALANEGGCDARGASEYDRCLREWAACGFTAKAMLWILSDTQAEHPAPGPGGADAA